MGGESDVGDQRGLADPGLACDQREAALAGGGGFPGCRERPANVNAADKRRFLVAAQTRWKREPTSPGLPPDAPGFHWVWEPFEGELSNRFEVVPTASSGQVTDHTGTQDASSGGGGAQAGGFYYRHAEVVV